MSRDNFWTFLANERSKRVEDGRETNYVDLV